MIAVALSLVKLQEEYISIYIEVSCSLFVS